PVSRVVVFGDWQRARTGKALADSGSTTPASSLGTHQVSLGLRADVPLFREIARPYVGVAALGVLATARFDDDVADPESLGQVAWSAFAPGALAVGGLELRLVPADRLALSWHAELGYALLGTLAFEEFGAYDVGGTVMRTGLGVRL
ncbi:MAG: hypothetical protein H0V89_12920, partial [Deltaproteobacteria bacterium]|nr:hypothetical protein [Deltaproteobacteria bacterium]